jgi:hypothetical protein
MASMKGEVVFVLRSKREFCRVNGAEPLVVGLNPQTAQKRRANTMKTYLLRTAKTVEPQKCPRRVGGEALPNCDGKRMGANEWGQTNEVCRGSFACPHSLVLGAARPTQRSPLETPGPAARFANFAAREV